jgi:hypothetical protein
MVAFSCVISFWKVLILVVKDSFHLCERLSMLKYDHIDELDFKKADEEIPVILNI